MNVELSSQPFFCRGDRLWELNANGIPRAISDPRVICVAVIQPPSGAVCHTLAEKKRYLEGND